MAAAGCAGEQKSGPEDAHVVEPRDADISRHACCVAFFHPDYTVGSGFPPAHAALRLVGFTTDLE